MNLLKSLQPFIDNFLRHLESKVKDFELKAKNFESEKEKVVQQLSVLQDQEKTNKDILYKHQQKLNNEISRQKNLQTELNNEISKTNKINKELYVDSEKLKNTLRNAEGESKLITEERDRQVKKSEEYQKKIDFLRIDFARLKDKENFLRTLERETKAKSGIVDRREEKIIRDEYELSQEKLELRAKEKRIKLEYTRLELDGS